MNVDKISSILVPYIVQVQNICPPSKLSYTFLGSRIAHGHLCSRLLFLIGLFSPLSTEHPQMSNLALQAIFEINPSNTTPKQEQSQLKVNFRSEERQKRLWHLSFYAFLLLRDAFRSFHHGEFPLAALETSFTPYFWLHFFCPNYFLSLLHRTPNSSPSAMQSHSTLPRLRLCSQTAKVRLRLPSLTKPSKLLSKATQALLREKLS